MIWFRKSHSTYGMRRRVFWYKFTYISDGPETGQRGGAPGGRGCARDAKL